jgi:hypothetical protein
MGGPGSGNHYHWWRSGKKAVVEDCLVLDASRWMREGILRSGVYLAGSWKWQYRSGKECSIGYEVRTMDPAQPTVQLSYSRPSRMTGQRESADYPVRLTTTRPRFGGLRWWFVCPLVVNDRHCSRRVGKLYLPPGSRYFGCRHCHDLTYTSCQESHKYDSVFRYLARDTGYDFATIKWAMNRMGKDRDR